MGFIKFGDRYFPRHAISGTMNRMANFILQIALVLSHIKYLSTDKRRYAV